MDVEIAPLYVGTKGEGVMLMYLESLIGNPAMAEQVMYVIGGLGAVLIVLELVMLPRKVVWRGGRKWN